MTWNTRVPNVGLIDHAYVVYLSLRCVVSPCTQKTLVMLSSMGHPGLVFSLGMR
jgi:hypothetical protein